VKDSEAVELYQERVKELELGATPNRPTFRSGARDSIMFGGGEYLGGLGKSSQIMVITVY